MTRYNICEPTAKQRLNTTYDATIIINEIIYFSWKTYVLLYVCQDLTRWSIIILWNTMQYNSNMKDEIMKLKPSENLSKQKS
jgi:hypothetical protein